MKHTDFLEEIIKELLGEPKDKMKKKIHCPEYIDSIKRSEKRQKCNKCGELTMWECKTCQVGEKRMYLCVPTCYKIRHMFP